MAKPYFKLNAGTQEFVGDIQTKKYMQPEDEGYWEQGTHKRLADVFFPVTVRSSVQAKNIHNAFHLGLNDRSINPAGRIVAGAGTVKNVTWYNCFIAPQMQDSMRTMLGQPGKGIMDTLADVAYSMQMGGGVGTAFSVIRPHGALVRRVMAAASGPLSFMDLWDSMCRTIMSAGERRGAMMATLSCDHADLFAFIMAKHEPSRLRMFNLSVLITDAFMEAVEKDEMWELGHWVEPFGFDNYSPRRRKYNPRSKEIQDWFVYSTHRARDIWETLMRSTHKYSEPGVIFIDRINRLNNLHYCEYIEATNPCGEQAMAPDDVCNLWHLNVCRCIVGIPYADSCQIDYQKIREQTRLLVRAGDRCVDLSPCPTENQHVGAQNKRRIGIGITGLANLFMFLRIRYGSVESIKLAEDLMEFITHEAYRESVKLAAKHGAFPLFDRDKYLQGEYIKTLPDDIRAGIKKYGIRNALLTTIAPVGTGSLAQGENCSSGLEPVFAFRYFRKVLQGDGSYKESAIEDFGFRVYANVLFNGDADAALAASLPDYMVTAPELSPEAHLAVMAALQKNIDNSISKTINLATETTLEETMGVYTLAYKLGCKSCTTYREDESSGRGSILSTTSKTAAPAFIPAVLHSGLRPRPDKLRGETARLRWASLPYPLFMTMNDEVQEDGSLVPFEVFINSKGVDYAQWITALTRVITAVMRKGGDLTFLIEELKSVWSARGGEFKGKQFVPSEVALIGMALEEHFRDIGYISADMPEIAAVTKEEVEITGVAYAELGLGEECPACGALQVIHSEGCKKCLACEWNKCG